MSIVTEGDRRRGAPEPPRRGADTNAGPTSARTHGRAGGRRPKLPEDQAALAQRRYDEREKTVRQIADTFSERGSTMYGHLDRDKSLPRQHTKTAATKPSR
ncbi:hypothetical protein ACIQVK_46880 [Streptomyces sp. NPDC090493]|uniref:hypothetical protein n=1 Tax=Streptomyces sp. NPDC090493 TaxID=3365964 RepID=UPI00381F604F